MAEYSPLLRHRPHQKKLNYNMQHIKSKAAILVLVWDAFITIYRQFMVYFVSALGGIQSPHVSIILTNVLANMYSIPVLLYPIGGLIADVWIGRYRMILVSVYICLITWIFNVIGYSVWWMTFKHVTIITVLLTVTSCLLLAGLAGFQSNIVPFNIDQLMGASGDELSALVHWHLFSTYFARLIASALPWFITSTFIYETISFIIPGITIISVIISMYLFKHWLDTTPHFSNPLKLIIGVLNYARKNKYPRNRSALTYWEENYPVRLDLGKERYGGPFSEEEVEDVKTILRVIPVLISVIGCLLSWDSCGLINHPLGINYANFFIYYMTDRCISIVICVCLILLYQFIIYPCFYKYIPNMLKRIGLGLVFSLFTTVSNMIIVLVSHFNDPMVECPLGIYTQYNDSIVLPISYKWLIIPQVMYGVSLFLVIVTSLEFTVAQSPRQMRGLVVGMWYAALGIGGLINDNIYLAFYPIKSKSLGCLFYYYLVVFVCILLILILYVTIAKCYKVRVREYVVPVYQIAEKHIEKYIDSQSTDSSDSSTNTE